MHKWNLAVLCVAVLASLEAQPVTYNYDHTELTFTVSPSTCAVGQNPLKVVLLNAQGPVVTQTLARLVKDNCLLNQNNLTGTLSVSAPASLTADAKTVTSSTRVQSSITADFKAIGKGQQYTVYVKTVAANAQACTVGEKRQDFSSAGPIEAVVTALSGPCDLTPSSLASAGLSGVSYSSNFEIDAGIDLDRGFPDLRVTIIVGSIYTQQPAAPPSSGTITIEKTQPQKGENLLALAGRLPPFFGAGHYTYGKLANVQLLLTDDMNTILGSQLQDLPMGTDANWGDLKPYLSITGVTTPTFAIPPGTPTNQVLGHLFLQAVLLDAATFKQVAASDKIQYNVVPGVSAVTVLVKRALLSNDYETVSPPVSSGFFFGAGVQVSLDYSGPPASLDALETTGSGSALNIEDTMDAEAVTSGKSTYVLTHFHGVLIPNSGTAVSFRPRLTTQSGQQALLPALTLPLQRVKIVSINPPNDCSSQKRQNCLLAGDTTNIEARLDVVAAQASQRVIRRVKITQPSLLPVPDVELPLIPTPGQRVPYTDTFSIRVPLEATAMQVTYELDCFPCSDARNYGAFLYSPRAISKNGPSKTDVLSNIKSGIDRTVNTLKQQAAISAIGNSLGVDLSGIQRQLSPSPGDSSQPGVPEAADRGRDAVANPDLLGLATTWNFDPPIPHDGSFSADISLPYSTADFPDDPNFAESKIQIVSLDTSGAVHVYATVLDLTNKIALAHLDGLDPYFSLAVVGPFAQTPVLLSNPASGYVLTNSGSHDSIVSTTEFAADATGTPSVVTLQTRHQQTGKTAAWVRSWPAASASVSGLSWFDNGLQYALAPAGTPGSTLVFTDVEYDMLVSTEIDLANTSIAPAQVTLNLLGPDGKEVGAFTQQMDAKGKLSQRVEELFPSVPAGFSGYLLAASDQPLSGSATIFTTTASAATNAQAITPASIALTRRYASGLGSAGTASTLHLVNVSIADVNVTLHAYSASGAKAANDVSFKLAAGVESTRDVSTAFGVDPTAIAMLAMDASAGGVYGDVSVYDSGFAKTFQISLPLTGERSVAQVLPLATDQTTVYLSNTGSSAASATVSPYGVDGTAGAGKSVTIPANGSVTVDLTGAPLTHTSGFANIASNQPLVVAALIKSAAGATSGYNALAASSSDSGPGGPTPAITAGGVGSLATYVAPLVRGSLAVLVGSNLAGSTSPALPAPLPSTYQGTSVTVNNIPAPLVFVSPGQINFQVPYEAPATGSAEVVVAYNGQVSGALSVAMANFAAGVFQVSASLPAVTHVDGSLVTSASPAKANEFVIIYLTGVGLLTNAPPTGSAAKASPLTTCTVTPTVSLAGAAATTAFCGLTPGYAGLVQVNAQLPATLPVGSSLPLVLSFSGSVSAPVNLAVSSSTPVGPSIGFSTTRLDFGTVTVGQVKDLPITITNTGTALLQVTGLTLPGFSDFFATKLPANLAPGEQGTLSMRFQPSHTGSQQVMLKLQSNDPAHPSVDLTVTGTGQ